MAKKKNRTFRSCFVSSHVKLQKYNQEICFGNRDDWGSIDAINTTKNYEITSSLIFPKFRFNKLDISAAMEIFVNCMKRIKIHQEKFKYWTTIVNTLTQFFFKYFFCYVDIFEYKLGNIYI